MTDLVERLRCQHTMSMFVTKDSLIACLNEERAEAATALEAQAKELEALRDIICKSAEAIGNGAALSPECSVEFMSQLPAEIAAHTASLRERVKEQTDLANRSIRRLAELAEPGAIGAFAARDHWQARAETAEQRIGELANAFGVPDGGRYRADWDSRIAKFHAAETAERERDEARAALSELADYIKSWTSPAEMRQRSGEMTAQEVRTVQAILSAILDKARAARAITGKD